MRAILDAVSPVMSSSLSRISGLLAASRMRVPLQKHAAAAARQSLPSSFSSPRVSCAAHLPTQHPTNAANVVLPFPTLLISAKFLKPFSPNTHTVSQLIRGFRSSAPCRSLDEFFVSFPELDNEKNPIYPAVGNSSLSLSGLRF